MSSIWAAAHLAGFGLVLAPWTFLHDGAQAHIFAIGVICWLAGGAMAGLGAVFFLAGPARCVDVARAAGPGLAIVSALAILAPEIGDLGQHVWYFGPITEITFASVTFVLEAIGMDVHSVPSEVSIRVGDFYVGIGRQCSGVEGFALITLFLLLYLYLFRKELRFPRVWLLLPIGIALSWCFNVVRISVLIWIGARVSPEVALNGFHSHAGWLLFTLLSLSLAASAHALPWLRRKPEFAEPTRGAAGGPPPLASDPNAAQIVPFIVFMGSALVWSTFATTPELLYPLKSMKRIKATNLRTPRSKKRLNLNWWLPN